MSDWANTVPLGTQWDNNSVDTTNIFSLTEMANANRHTAKHATKKRKQSKKSSDSAELPFYGDRSFSEAATFKRDAMISREVAYAAAEGDVGRIWEGLKVNVSKLDRTIRYLMPLFRQCYSPLQALDTPITLDTCLR
jgi:hypothetical protein